MKPTAHRFAGKEKRLAFGVYPDVTLKMAREKRDSARQRVKGAKPGDYSTSEARNVDAAQLFVQTIDSLFNRGSTLQLLGVRSNRFMLGVDTFKAALNKEPKLSE